MARELGKSRRVPIRDLQVGHKLQDHIRGMHGKVLMAAGEVLTKVHIDHITKWDSRPGNGRLSIYTREVQAVMTDASGDERPKCEADPEKSIVNQLWYKSNSGVTLPKHYAGTRLEKAAIRKMKEKHG